MALDTQKAARQMAELKRCAAQAETIRRGLTRYRTSLDAAWYGDEVPHLDRTVDALAQQYRRQATQLEELRREVDRAVQEILAEEAAAEEEGT